MNCLAPIWMYDTGRLTANGKRLLTAKYNPVLPSASPIPVPCGKCSACLLRRRLEWVNRLRLENMDYDGLSSYITLTYAENPITLPKCDVQNFIKRLRNSPRDYSVKVSLLRYIVTGEYGSRRGRPHWHGIIFGADFLSDEWSPFFVRFNEKGYPIYSSRLLEKIWAHGFVTCDRVTLDDIKYVAKYIFKDGSVSLKSQGLGRSRFVSVSRSGRKTVYRLRDLFVNALDNGFVVLPDRHGRFSPVGLPKSFDRYLERCDPSLFDSVRARRRDFVRNSNPFAYGLGECRAISDYQTKQAKKLGVLDDESKPLFNP